MVDKDNYLLEVSRYVHLNAVAARLVERAGQYRWSSYGAYLKGNGIRGLETQKLLDYFTGGRTKQVEQYWKFVEGEIAEKKNLGELPVRKQAFIGDEEFEEAVRKRAGKHLE